MRKFMNMFRKKPFEEPIPVSSKDGEYNLLTLKDLKSLPVNAWIEDSTDNRFGGLIKITEELWELRDGSIVGKNSIKLPAKFLG